MEASTLCKAISDSPHDFLVPSRDLHLASRLATKSFLDPLASNVVNVQDSRQNIEKTTGRKNKIAAKNRFRVHKLHLDGFSVGQVWEQAVRILNESSDQLSYEIDQFSKSLEKRPDNSQRLSSPHSSASDDDGLDEDEISDSDEGSLVDMEGSASGLEGTEQSEEEEKEDEEEESDEDAEDDIEDIEKDSNADSEEGSSPRETYVEDKFGLNDGFFSIDDFNKQSEYFERIDERGDQEDLSDDDDIDWHANPTTAGAGRSTKSHKPAMDEDEIPDSEDSDAGPTFGDAALGDDDSDEDLDENAMGADWLDTNDIKYNDFFAPPPRKVSKKKSRPLPKTQPTTAPTDDDVERAISDVRRDLFDDVSDDAESDMDMDAAEVEGSRSTHEKQKAKIADEIRRLELANVTKKEWMLVGEAKGTQRPLNSLIEEDLEFERVGKPVPVVTDATSEEIEQLIKRRIIAKEFDEVIRRLPDSLRQHEVSRGRVEVDQTKPQQSLAELYENEHLRATDPSYVDPKNEKLKREHAEIAQLWKNTSSQLDALSNWHYKPSIPQPNINVIADVATVMMEDARPSGSGTIGDQGTLAPQEVYHPKDAPSFGGEVVLKNGVSVAKTEMSREEKSRRRRAEKKKFQAASQKPGKPKVDEGQQILSDLKKGGVQMVGQGGELKSLNERQKSDSTAATPSFKL